MGDLLAKFDIMTPSDGERQAPKVKSRDITNKKTREILDTIKLKVLQDH